MAQADAEEDTVAEIKDTETEGATEAIEDMAEMVPVS